MIRLKLHYIFDPCNSIYINLNAHMFLQAQLYTLLELCRAFDRIFKEHLDGG